jgi:hypothetical protein
MRTLESVEAAEAATSTCDTRQADVEETRNVGETPRDAGKEEEALLVLRVEWEEPPQQPSQQQQEERPLEPQPEVEQHELGQPEGPLDEVEQEAVVLPPDAQAGTPASGGPLPPQGSALAMIDLIVDDSPSDKGKQKVDVGMVKAFDQPRTSTAPDDDAMETSGGWPDFVELALVRAEEELPRWGQLTLEFRDAANPDAEPFFTLDDKDEVQHYEYVEGLRKHSVRSLRMVMDTLVRHMSGAFEVGSACVAILHGMYPLFSLVLILVLTMVRNSRSNRAASCFSFAMKAACGP